MGGSSELWLRMGTVCVQLNWVMSVNDCIAIFLLQLSYPIKGSASLREQISQRPEDKNAKHKSCKWNFFSSPGQWPIHVITGPVQAASNIPWRMSCTITSSPHNWFFFFYPLFFFWRHYSSLFLHMSQRFRICDLKQPEESDFTGGFLGD